MEQDQFDTETFPGATTASKVITIQNGVDQGSIHIVTPSDYDGSTGTLALKGSNDNSNFTTVYQDDNVTAMSFTLATASQYSWLLKRVLYKYYQLVYTKGNTTAGTIAVNFNGKK